MLCFLYVTAISSCFGLAALLTERALPAAMARRWVWCVAIGLSMVVPPLYRSKHVAHIGAGSLAPDVTFWERLNSIDVMRPWLVASVMLILWGAFNVVRISLALRRTRRDRSNVTHLDGVPVLATDSLGPATFGVFRARVLIPRWVLAMPRDQQQYIVRHEDEHRKANDARLLFLASLMLIVTPWNIALWWQLRRLSLAVELDCDHRVVNALGNADKYGELLLTIAEAATRGPRLQPGFVGGMGSLERRLTTLVAPPQISRFMRLALPAVAIALLIAVLSAPHPVTGSATSHRLATSQASHR